MFVTHTVTLYPFPNFGCLTIHFRCRGRLTWNFWRKGGFSGGEDYRWAEVKKWYPGWQFELFNLVFISFFQQALLLAFVTPAAAALHSDRPLSILDYVAAALYTLLWLGETVADLQMFAYQVSCLLRFCCWIILRFAIGAGNTSD
jgi:steroid 5-alpha reductase family enzyme